MSEISVTQQQKSRLRELGVSSLYLFGSHAQGVAGAASDFDFAVLMQDSSRVHPYADVMPLYQSLYDILTSVLPGVSIDPVVDIVFLQGGVSLELQANVVKHGRLLFDEDPSVRADYEAQVMMRMADLSPIIQAMDKAILQRL